MRATFAMLVTALLLPGCSTPDDSSAAPTTEAADPVQPEVGGNVTLMRQFAGTIIVRPATYPTYTGDPPGFCFNVPENTELLHGHLVWDPPHQMGLEFHGDGNRYTSFQGAEGLAKVTPPIDLAVESPGAGEWYTYAGPGVVGGAVNRNLTLTFHVARADAVPTEVDPIKEC